MRQRKRGPESDLFLQRFSKTTVNRTSARPRKLVDVEIRGANVPETVRFVGSREANAERRRDPFGGGRIEGPKSANKNHPFARYNELRAFEGSSQYGTGS